MNSASGSDISKGFVRKRFGHLCSSGNFGRFLGLFQLIYLSEPHKGEKKEEAKETAKVSRRARMAESSSEQILSKCLIHLPSSSSDTGLRHALRRKRPITIFAVGTEPS